MTATTEGLVDQALQEPSRQNGQTSRRLVGNAAGAQLMLLENPPPGNNTLQIRAAVNEWISERLPVHRKHLRHSAPEYVGSKGLWRITLKADKHSDVIGTVLVSRDASVVEAEPPDVIIRRIDRILASKAEIVQYPNTIRGDDYAFHFGDGVAGAADFAEQEIDLLLTDPPYGISKSYTCETQVPRRLRNNGADFIMPKGNFGDWDSVDPQEWLNNVLPKVGGWAVSFCAQAQIGEYQHILEAHKFVAIGTMVWQKTNPVPFNHRYKPINAWEAIVVGKRPGTKFNGRVIHNVFLCKSPSPQKRIHSTQKPLDLMERFVELFTDPGDLVYDPFGGGATTLIAAARNERKTVSYERDAEIYQSACGRIQEYLP